jgi:hypothetical protein
MVWWTTAPIAIPIILGFVTLFWQAKTAFQLKTAEVLMESKSTRAAKERAQALRKLFPRYVSEKFVKVFNTEFKLPGLAYQEKKLELFKALAATVKEKKDVFQLYMMLYADEEATFKDFAANWQMTFEDDSDWIRRSTEKLQKK